LSPSGGSSTRVELDKMMPQTAATDPAARPHRHRIRNDRSSTDAEAMTLRVQPDCVFTRATERDRA
jgi:hypothetical protein